MDLLAKLNSVSKAKEKRMKTKLRESLFTKEYVQNGFNGKQAMKKIRPGINDKVACSMAGDYLKRKDVQLKIMEMTGMIGLNKDFIQQKYLEFLNDESVSEKGRIHALGKLGEIIGVFNKGGNQGEGNVTNALNIINIVADSLKPEQRQTLAPVIEKYSNLKDVDDNLPTFQ